MPDPLQRSLDDYARTVFTLAPSPTTIEPTYYPAVASLLIAILRHLRLPTDVRTNTSERRTGGGVDMPDVALYDGSGDFVAVCGEVKPPTVEIAEMARSLDRNDQIGRYLARTRVVLLCNIRALGLLTVDPAYTDPGPIPPARRRLEQVVDLWPNVTALHQNRPIDPEAVRQLQDLVEAAVTRYAPIAEPETLARVLANRARRAKRALPDIFGQAVQSLKEDFGSALGITFEGEEGDEFFRSSLVQTVFYSLFAGWMLHKRSGNSAPFRWQDLPHTLKIPFLGALFYDIQHPMLRADLNLEASLNEAAETLERVEDALFFQRLRMPSLQEGEDPERAAATAILYFYEPFLEAFDPELRKALGVWYTPPEIVRYQVRKIHRLLQDELGCERGFADEQVVVLDPCCGTGAYLIEVVHCIAETLRAEGIEADLGDRVIDALCRRVIGFEILTAPFVITHLQLYLLLAGLGVEPRGMERLAVFLTNALTGWQGEPPAHLHFPELQREHDAAHAMKTRAQIIVVLGNPPYNRFAGAAIAEEADLVDHYKGIRRERRAVYDRKQGRRVEKLMQAGDSRLYTEWRIRKHLLDDLYIRFFRLAEKSIAERADFGIVSFISNSSFYVGRSHPIMRESLLHGFDTIWVDNLHGNRLASERTPWGESCETLFHMEGGGPGIKVGTGITTLLKRRRKSEEEEPAHGPATVHYRDFWGRAAAKRGALLESLAMDSWDAAKREEAAAIPGGPRSYEAFTPTRENRWKLAPRGESAGYADWPSLEEMFPAAFQGVNPNRGLEGSVVEMDRGVLEARMREYFSAMPYAEFATRHPELCTARARYEPGTMRDLLRKRSGFHLECIVPYEVFPLDLRWLYYETEGKLLNERRPELWENLAGNEFLIAVPQPRRTSETRPLLARSLFDLHLHDRGSVGFPAEVTPEAETGLFHSSAPEESAPRANLAEPLWEALRDAWGLQKGLEAADAKRLARRLFRLCLAVCHAPQYQEDHADALANDWAHVPIPRDRPLFEQLADLGDRIAILLDPTADARSVLREILGAEFGQLAVLSRVGGGAVRGADAVVTIPHFGGARGGWQPTGEETGDLYINAAVYFRNVPQEVWRFELGGYPVLKKWLGYRDARRRNGQPLAITERDDLRGIVQRLAALRRLQPDADRLYQQALDLPFTLQDLGFA